MSKIANFRLDPSFCQNSKISPFFSKTLLMRWNNLCENPKSTPQDILDTYNLSLIYIATNKNIKPDVILYVREMQEQVNHAKYLQTIGDTLINIRRLQAKKRVFITDDTREDFQTARTNDRMNQESDIYADWNNEVDQQVHPDNQAINTDNEESPDHLYLELCGRMVYMYMKSLGVSQ
ncbi:15291_t:CDS:2 [Dentiscutata erythropus]|uniref:15291_t:CDS:1 n=1 Tax=Dentiscutata erythropus TaxID=1348616 RepID=A0A9N8ZYV3_9GLOM|nr:15291_t:CDS:2 [Dentiscutata erythropus]